MLHLNTDRQKGIMKRYNKDCPYKALKIPEQSRTIIAHNTEIHSYFPLKC